MRSFIKYVWISINGQLIIDQVTQQFLFQQSCLNVITRRRRESSQILNKEQPVTRTGEAQVSFRVVTESIVHNQANGKILSKKYMLELHL